MKEERGTKAERETERLCPLRTLCNLSSIGSAVAPESGFCSSRPWSECSSAPCSSTPSAGCEKRPWPLGLTGCGAETQQWGGVMAFRGTELQCYTTTQTLSSETSWLGFWRLHTASWVRVTRRRQNRHKGQNRSECEGSERRRAEGGM